MSPWKALPLERHQERRPSDDWLTTLAACPGLPTHQLDSRPSLVAPTCWTPSQPGWTQAEAPWSARWSPSPPCPPRQHGPPGLGGFPGLLPYRLFRLPFCWGCQFSGFLGWLCFNLSPRSRLRRLPLSLGREEMEGPGSLGQALEPADFQEQMLESPGGSAAPPTCLPPNRPGELLKMQFPFIFPVKSLPVP